MKELTTLASNFCAIITESGKLSPELEIGIVLSEPQYRHNTDGGLIRERVCETVRFSISPEKAIKLADQLKTLADQCIEEFDKALHQTADAVAQSPPAGDKPKPTHLDIRPPITRDT